MKTNPSGFSFLDAQLVEANRRGEVTPAQERMVDLAMVGALGCLLRLLPVLIAPFICLGGLWLLNSFKQPGYVEIVFAVAISGLAVGLLSWVLVGLYRRSVVLRADLTGKIIHQADGQLVAGADDFAIQAAGQALRLPVAGSGGLVPGATYRFYFLPRTGYVLSAEQLGPIDETRMRQGLEAALVRANGFSPEDLAANRRGLWTSRQRYQLLPQLSAGLAILIVLATLLLFAIISAWVGSHGEILSASTGILFVTCFLGVFALIGLALISEPLTILLSRRVVMAQGLGRRELHGRSGSKQTYTRLAICA